mmetsp:Transcript_49089/g.114816  ORF Transcript_49089/g.114816 Transcript_49089/m.114816 type:complete len:240 (-) Transcript_49089:1704-2423(-)
MRSNAASGDKEKRSHVLYNIRKKLRSYGLLRSRLKRPAVLVTLKTGSCSCPSLRAPPRSSTDTAHSSIWACVTPDLLRANSRKTLRIPTAPSGFLEMSISVSLALFSKTSSRMSAPRKSMRLREMSSLSRGVSTASFSMKYTIGVTCRCVFVAAEQLLRPSVLSRRVRERHSPIKLKTSSGKQFQPRFNSRMDWLVTRLPTHLASLGLRPKPVSTRDSVRKVRCCWIASQSGTQHFVAI